MLRGPADHPTGPSQSPAPTPATHRPGGRLGGARLLEGDLEVVWPRVVSVGRDDGRRRHGVEGRAGLRVGRVGGRAGRVFRGVGAARGRAAAHLVHGATEQIELGLAGSRGGVSLGLARPVSGYRSLKGPGRTSPYSGGALAPQNSVVLRVGGVSDIFFASSLPRTTPALGCLELGSTQPTSPLQSPSLGDPPKFPRGTRKPLLV